MKECSGKKVQKVKVVQNDPLDSSSQKNWPDGQQDQGGGVFLHVQEEVYQSTLKKKENLKSIINYEKVSKKPERSEIKDSRVNYICKVDVIT